MQIAIQISQEFGVAGPSEEYDNFKHQLRGVIPRSFEHLFNLISREHELVSRPKYFVVGFLCVFFVVVCLFWRKFRSHHLPFVCSPVFMLPVIPQKAII